MRTKSLIIISCICVVIGWYITSVILSVRHDPRVSYGSLVLRDTHGIIMTDKGSSGGYMVPYEGSLSGRLFDAIITIEDRRFIEHRGVDIRGKLAGIWDNIQAGQIVRGSSTLTEQYLKNAYYRGRDRTILQKVDEAIGAIWIEQTQGKDEILREYLNHIYFGNRIYGIRAAVSTYFPQKSIATLTDDDILDLITRIHSPNISAANIDRVKTYRTSIANKLGWNEGESHLTDGNNWGSVDLFPLVTLRVQDAIRTYCSGEAQELEKWTKKIPENLCTTNKKELTLTLDIGLQRYTEDLIEKTITRIEKENVTGSAVYIYDPAHQKILAYVGNRGQNTSDCDIDMITRRRSVGSVLKPFIYLMALREGAELESLILDDTRTYPTGVDGKMFVPQNYNPRSYGPIRLREALGNSLNSATVRLSESIGIGRIYDFFGSVGLALDHDAGYYGYGISLGTVELSLENIVESYSYLTDMRDPDIFLIRQALSDSKNRARTFGISSILNSSIELPVKTGTSTDFRDNWAISYGPDAIIGVWVGNSDASPMEDVSGVSGAGPIWHSIAEYMIGQSMITRHDLTIPPGVSETYSCLDTKCLQREHTYMKNPGSIQSRTKDGLYYEQDFVGKITQEEKEKWNIR